MKIFSLIIAIVSGLLLSSTLICGLWIRANKVTDVSSLNFHMSIGIASVLFSLIAVILLMRLALRL
ncbi:hypothetical protein SAMN02745975_01700 [Geosporobacter subterraneus DSM 17957]|uniref:Uncharacterized protein n=1 Tax=Geosporobacter subterraneus DSM 17957 TaxID=1121919 RepID=A0A1M6I0J2_9FIRM|nr:hypothetical protein [Geosporobacter subterraneus]SHJ28029.1 hypothetical protein SAMN02745975_01700 [Geosporobacter subterraneus DSM 17957]